MMEKYFEIILIIDEVKEEKIFIDLKVKVKISQSIKIDFYVRQQLGRKKDMIYVLFYLKKNKYDDIGIL